MQANLLLPNKFKRIGIFLLIPSTIFGIYCRFEDFSFSFLTIKKTEKLLFENEINLTDEIALTGIIVSLMFIAFAREKQEDEFIESIRLKSLQWAVLVNYSMLILATWLIHGFGFIDVMMYNMLTVLIIFIARFHLVLRKNRIANPEQL
jgi:hypothetical protein